ncbi:hypothetical protein F5Y06DRAFT_265372 [Hypoxylon sp. FL0890]|nr:hypothetical protein F5Y06DRAFT_265372 [Hypoxylon sp. FL0890]
MANYITPGQIAQKLQHVLVYDERNPNYCPCGWYLFYGFCGHLVAQHPHRCGASQTQSMTSKFCRSPAPRHNVNGYTLSVYCPGCARMNH